MTKRKKGKHRRKPRHSAAEYFLAATGLLIIAFIVAMALSFRSCELHVPGLVPPPATTPTPAPPAP